jgi:hypothetical protein
MPADRLDVDQTGGQLRRGERKIEFHGRSIAWPVK